MPSYEVEVRLDDGGVTRTIISMSDSLEIGDVFEDKGRALRIWRIEEARPPHDQRLICDLYDWDTFLAEIEEGKEETIVVAPEAAERISSNVGRLYIWEKPLGGFLEDKASFKPPGDDGISFDTFDVAGVQILIASDIELPEKLSITPGHWPPLKLHIDWDRQAMGTTRPGVARERHRDMKPKLHQWA